MNASLTKEFIELPARNLREDIFMKPTDNIPEQHIEVNAEEVRQAISAVAAATVAIRPLQLQPMSPLERQLDAAHQWLFSHAMHAATVMLGSGLLSLYMKSKPLAETSAVLGGLSSLLIVAMFIAAIASFTPFLWRMFKTPYAPLLSLVQLSAQHDLQQVCQLIGFSKETLQYVLMQYKFERNAYERRSGMLAGTIDKVGIFPALAGLVLLVSNLLKIPGVTAWGSLLGPLLLAFYFLSIATCQMTLKMDKVIALLEFCIQQKK